MLDESLSSSDGMRPENARAAIDTARRLSFKRRAAGAVGDVARAGRPGRQNGGDAMTQTITGPAREPVAAARGDAPEQRGRRFGADLDLARDESRLRALLEAFAEVARDAPEDRLHIAARRGPDARFLLWNEVERLGLQEQVTYAPYTDVCRRFPVFKADCARWFDGASLSERAGTAAFGRRRAASRRVLFVTYMHPWKLEGNSRLMRDWIDAFGAAGYAIDLLYYAGDPPGAVTAEMARAAAEACAQVETVAVRSPLVGSNTNGLNVHVDDWCGPELLEAVDGMVARQAYDVAFVNYAFLSAVFERVPAYTRKLLMTHDRFEDRNRRMLAQGFPESGWLSLTRDGEALACARADRVIAIQPEEAAYFEGLADAPDKVVTVSPVIAPTPVPPAPPAPDGRLRIGYFGAHNHVNELNLGVFLDAWQARPGLRDGAALVLAGSLCEHLEDFVDAGALAAAAPRMLGRVDDLAELFAACDLVINPERGGTGLKIKSLETMAHGMPLFCTAAGAVGFASDSRFHAAPDIPALADLVAAAVADRALVDVAREETRDVYRRYCERNRDAAEALIGSAMPRQRPIPPAPPLPPPPRTGRAAVGAEDGAEDGAALARRVTARLDPDGRRVLVLGSGPDRGAERVFAAAGAAEVLSLPGRGGGAATPALPGDVPAAIRPLRDLAGGATAADLICRLPRPGETADDLAAEIAALAPCLAPDGHACLFVAGDAAERLPVGLRGLAAPVRLARAAISQEGSARPPEGAAPVPSELWMRPRPASPARGQDAAEEVPVPSVSVIVPFYNVEAYLDACLDSLRGQDHPELEIVLVDDASPDGSRAIAERHAADDGRVLIVTHEANAGLGPARNTGVARASGDYLIFVDSDDVLAAPDTLRRLVAAARDSGAQVVTGRAEKLFDDGRRAPFDTELERRAGAEADARYSGREAFLATFGLKGMGYLPMRAWAYLIDADFYRETGLDFPPGAHEDVGHIPVLCHLANEVVYLPDTVLLYRMRDGSIARSGWSEARARGFAGVWRHFRDLLGQHGLDDLRGAAAMMTARQALWKLQADPPAAEALPGILAAVGEVLRDADDIAPARIRAEGMAHLALTLDALGVDEGTRAAALGAVAPGTTIAYHRALLGLGGPDPAQGPVALAAPAPEPVAPTPPAPGVPADPLPAPDPDAWERNHARAEGLLEQYRAAAPEASKSYPSMLTEGDKAVYYDAGLQYRGDGLIVDGGCFVGGTTHHLVLGLKHNPAFPEGDPRLAEVIKVFDLFRIDDDYILEHLRANFPGRAFASGGSFEDTFRDQMAADAGYLQVFPGDVMASGYPFERPIEVLGVDLCKALPVTDYVVRTFFPRLMPGGLVIQQDFIHEFHPHIHLSMLRLDDMFELDAEMKWGGSVTWRSKGEITPALIAERFGEDAGWFQDRARNVPLLEELCERTFYDENRWIMLLTLGFYHHATGDTGAARAAYDRACRLYPQFEPSEITRRHLAG
jgi:glycosyltransferase involved in cell wall biosynthesis